MKPKKSTSHHLEFEFILSCNHTYPKKGGKALANGFRFDFKVYYYGLPYDQGQLTEVPLNFYIFTIKVVGQTINSSATNKKSKL